jgi:transposase-like protein
MSKDIVQEALDNAKAMKEAALDNAKRTLVEAMSTNLKSVVAEAIEEQINENENVPADYHEGKKDKNIGSDRVGDEVNSSAPNSDDPAAMGDGPSIVEAGVEDSDEELEEAAFVEGEDEEDMDEYVEMEEMEDDDEDMDEGDYMEYMEGDDEDDDVDVDIDIDADGDEDDEEDMDEVIEIVDEAEEGIEEGEDMDTDEIVEEMVALDRENRQLRKENARLNKAVEMLNSRIDEVNLFNARLAATSDLMRKVSLTKEEKERAVKLMDTASSVKEVKRTYKALYEGYKAGGRQVTTKRVNRRPVHSVMSESVEKETPNVEGFDRIAQLAGIK